MCEGNNVFGWAPNEEVQKEWETLDELLRARLWNSQRVWALLEYADWCEEVFCELPRWRRMLVQMRLAYVASRVCPPVPPPDHLQGSKPPFDLDGPPRFSLTWAGVATLVAVTCATLGTAAYLLFT